MPARKPQLALTDNSCSSLPARKAKLARSSQGSAIQSNTDQSLATAVGGGCRLIVGKGRPPLRDLCDWVMEIARSWERSLATRWRQNWHDLPLCLVLAQALFALMLSLAFGPSYVDGLGDYW